MRVPATSPPPSVPSLQSLLSPHSLPWMPVLSIPRVPPSQLWGVKRSPTAATWGMGTPGSKQRTGASEGEPHLGSSISPGSSLGAAGCCLTSGAALPSSAAARRRHLVSGTSVDCLGMPTVPSFYPPRGSGKEGGSWGCSTVSPYAELLLQLPLELSRTV